MAQTNFSVSRTEYVRVNKFKVIQVQIHPQTTTGKKLWFEEKHFQEVMQLVKPVILERSIRILTINNKNTKDTTEAGLLSGTTVRIGYSFKRKRQHQTCLLPRNISKHMNEDIKSDLYSDNLRSSSLSGIYRYFDIFKEKLIVYVCPINDVSQNIMTQLLTISGCNSKQGVGISSYFRKSPQNKQTTSISTVSQSLPTPCPLSTSNPPDESKKKIQNLIKRSGPKLSRKKKKAKKVIPKRNSLLNAFKVIIEPKVTKRKNKTEDNDDLGAEVNDDMEVKSCSSSDSDIPGPNGAASKEEDMQINSKENEVMSDENNGRPLVRKAKKYTKKLPMTDTKLIESVVAEKTNVKNSDKVDPYDFDSQDLSLESTKKPQVETVQAKSKLKTKFPQIVTTPEKDPQSSTMDINKEIPELIITNYEKTDNNLVSAKTDNENSDSPDSSTPNLVKSKTRLRCPRLSTIFNHSVDTSLPSASFVNKPKVVSPAEIIPYKANVVSHTEIIPFKADIVTPAETITVNVKDKSPETVSPSKGNNKDEVKQMRKTRSIKSRMNSDKNSSVNDFQETEVLPKISLPKERNKRKQPESKSVATKPKAKSRKVTKTNNYDIFKTSTSEKKAERSILDLLNNSKSPMVKALKPSDIKSSSMKVAADFDILLIEELSDIPKVKDEKNLDLRREVLEIEEISDLKGDHIKMLVLNSESYLRDIFQGKVVCERHQDYKKGGMDRNNLNYQVHLELFTDDQHDVVMETLMEMFCKKHHKYMDYILKVLLPEVLIKIYMEVKGTTHQETEKIMKSPNRFEK